MRNLLALFAAVSIAFGVACYYRGWCSVEPLSSDIGKSAFRVEIDRIKIAQDVMEGARALQRALNTEKNDKNKDADNQKVNQPAPETVSE